MPKRVHLTKGVTLKETCPSNHIMAFKYCSN